MSFPLKLTVEQLRLLRKTRFFEGGLSQVPSLKVGKRFFSVSTHVRNSTGISVENGTAFPDPTSAYVHLPFCKKRCHYCDFPIVTLGTKERPFQQKKIQSYGDILKKEILATCSRESKPSLKTVFFGGGTPSLVSPEVLRDILEVLDAKFGIQQDAEVSMEMDPGTFDAGKLEGFLKCGVNRVSLGVQVFNDQLLKACGRSHNLDDVMNAIAMIHSLGVKNWSLDLISSLPGQDMKEWKNSLSAAVAASPSHLSIYDLQIEEKTAFSRWYSPGEGPLPSFEISAEMYREASSTLQEAGYLHYEISNFAKPGSQCTHNLAYWKNKSYYGFGLGATSYVNGQRFGRPKNMAEYEDFVGKLEFSRGFLDFPVTSKEEGFLDTVMLGLRLSEGLQREEIVKSFGEKAWSQLKDGVKDFVQSGLVEMVDKSGNVLGNSHGEVESLRLTKPEGFLLSNEVISSLFSLV